MAEEICKYCKKPLYTAGPRGIDGGWTSKNLFVCPECFEKIKRKNRKKCRKTILLFESGRDSSSIKYKKFS